MRTIKILPLALVGLILTVSCSNSQKTQVNSTETKVEATAAGDSITGRGCFELVSETPYDIPAQRFDETAQALAHASGCFIDSDLSETGSVQVNAIQGKMSIRDAILKAIDGTGLVITEETETKIKVELDSAN